MTPVDPLAIARRHFAASGGDAWLVGGRVRDLLLGRTTSDTDVAVPAGAMAHAQALARAAGGAFVALDAERDVGRVVWPDSGVPRATLDIAAFTAPDIAADLAGRDFTVNALAVPLAWPGLDGASGGADRADRDALRAVVLDPLGGLADLDARLVRMTGVEALASDPLRLLRGPRLAGELGFGLDPDTAAAIRARAPSLARPAGERVRDELLKLIAADDAAAHIRGLADLGLLEVILPEVAALRGVPQPPPHDRDVFEHSLSVLAAMERIQAGIAGRGAGTAAALDDAWRLTFDGAWDGVLAERRAALADRMADPDEPGWPGRAVWLRMAALLHDIGKPSTMWYDAAVDRIRFPQHDHVGTGMVAAVARRLHLSHGARDFLTAVIRHHMRPLYLAADAEISNRMLHRYFKATGDIAVDLVILSMADNAAKSGGRPGGRAALANVAARVLAAWYDAFDVVVAPAPLVDGNALMAALEIAPGPAVGRLLAALAEARAEGEIADAAEALALARRLVEAGV